MKNEEYGKTVLIETLKKGIAKRSPYEFGLEKPGKYLGTGRNKSYWR